jgi:hypothetical protein
MEWGVADKAALAKLGEERDKLLAQKEIAQLRAEIRSMNGPWWRRAPIVTALTTIVAAIVPTTTAVQGFIEKQKQLDLETAKESDAIRSAYLDRLKDPDARFFTLRFVMATSDDPKMREWAKTELEHLSKQLDKWADDIARQEKITQDLEAHYQELLAQSKAPAPVTSGSAKAPAPTPATPTQGELEMAKQKAEQAKKHLVEQQAKFIVASKPCNCSPGDPLCSCQ